MLPKRERLSRSDFSRFFAHGRRYHSAHLTLIYTPSPSFFGAVVVSKKVARRSVTRHALKRTLYALLAETRSSGVQTGAYIVIAKRGVESRSLSELRAEYDTLIQRVVAA